MTARILDSRDFYDRQAAIHELMNDWPARLSFELPFIRQTLEQTGARTVLDAACGGGHHAIALAQADYTVSGADLSAEMIAQARLNAQRAGAPVRFEPVGFADLGTHFEREAFDAALCLGNSLPHVLMEADQLAALQAMRDRLKSGGVLILQNLNYDLRWKNRPRFLMLNPATLDGRTVLIWRMADYHDAGARVAGWGGPCPKPGLITFHIAVIEQEAGGKTQEAGGKTQDAGSKWQATVTSTFQRPLFADDLARWLAQVGFKDLTFFGGMDGSPFTPGSSPDLVIVARA
jgi:2-polyprenyl-3-methyl-5-hydroxy-6-metoxy-1,4-benzoquinol methylase